MDTSPAAPMVKYTGTEVCPKCGYTELTMSYNPERDALELQCGRCAHRWLAEPITPG